MTRSPMLALVAATTAMSVLSGCTVGPDYAPPEMAVPAAYSLASDLSQMPGPLIDPATWWTAYPDPQLASLIERALADNPDIGIAASRVRQARLQEISARARGLPSFGANADVSHIEFSKNAGLSSIARAFSDNGRGASGGGSDGAPSGGIALPGSGITTYAAGFDASWELDVFGQARRGTEAARARTEAAIWNSRDASVMLAAEVGQAYFALRFDAQQIEVIEREMAAQARIAAIADHSADVGLIPRIDAVNAREALTANRARIEPVKADIVVRRHAIALLLGMDPQALDPELTSFFTPLAPAPAIPAGLPSNLLRRRPDIRAAERELAASTAEIGVAAADLYPKFNLTGVAQLISTAFGNLFMGDSLQLTGAGAVTFPIFDFGQRKAGVSFAEESRGQAYIRYRQTVLGALRDVVDPLARIDAEQRCNAALRQALSDANANARAAEARFATGFVAEDAALEARTRAMRAAEDLAVSDARLRQESVALFKAIGGGWSE